MRERFQRQHNLIRDLEPLRAWGRIRRVVGMIAEAEGLALPIGATCQISSRRTGRKIPAEVVGFREGRSLLLPFSTGYGLSEDDILTYQGTTPQIRVGEELIGRVLDGKGNPIDGKGPTGAKETFPLYGIPLNPLKRKRIKEAVSTGVRIIDSMLTCGKGARMGIFSGTGVGKSVLLGMIARNCNADLSVIALVGERGREVREFLERDLGEKGLSRSIVFVATSDQSPVLRLRALHAATSTAEYFRALGKDVMLLVDSITRVAMAQREIGLAAGEFPASRGYTPSVFALLPRVLERAGAGPTGTITAFYSVLVEADDISDPIGDAVRGILDGHIWLSRDLAAKGQWPAVDVLNSVSRVMPDVITEEELRIAEKTRSLMAALKEVEDLVRLGAYVKGSDPLADRALSLREKLEGFFRQSRDEFSDGADSRKNLRMIVEEKTNARA